MIKKMKYHKNTSNICDKFSTSVSHETLVGGTATFGMAEKRNQSLSERSAFVPLFKAGTFASLLSNSTKVLENLLQNATHFGLSSESKRMRKFWAMSVLTIVLSLNLSTAWAVPQTWNCGKKVGSDYGSNVQCTLDDDGIFTISGNGNMADFEYNYTYNTGNTPWKDHIGDIQSIVVENGSNISNVGNRAFQNATSLESVNIPGVTSIGNAAFAYTSLTSIYMPNVRTIGNYTFEGATALSGIDTSNITSIGENAFRDADNLTSIDLSNVTSIGTGAFLTSDNLREIVIPDTLTAQDTVGWGNQAFSGAYIQNIRCIDSEGNDSININACAAALARFLPDENGSCQSGIYCLSGVKKVGNTCVGQYFGSTNNDGTCTTKSSCNNSGNYINTDTRQCMTPANCTGMYVADTVNKKCFKMPGCVNYADGACQECDNGYLTNSSGSCTPAADCKNGMHATLDGACEENPAGCNTFEDDRCLECNDGLFRQGESCVSSCGEGYKLDNGICWRVRYTPAEAAKIVGESNTIYLYYK